MALARGAFFAWLTDASELLRESAVSATRRISAYRFDAMMDSDRHGALARMTFTGSRECLEDTAVSLVVL